MLYLDGLFFAFVWVIVVGLNPLQDRGKGFDIYETVGSQQYWVLYAGFSLVTLLCLVKRPIPLFRLFDVSLLALLGWAAITLSVSAVPVQAITDYGKQIAFIAGIAAFFVLYGNSRDLLVALRYSLLIVIVADVLAVFLVPDFAIHQINDATEWNLAGSWRGLHEHKGKFGELLAVASVLFYWDWRQSRRWTALAIAIACNVLTFPASSKVAMVAVAMSIVLTEIILWFSNRVNGWSAAILLAPIVFVVSLFGAVLVPLTLEVTTGDVTFSGRTRTWDFLLGYSAEHPWMGSGFSSFFIGKEGALYLSGNSFLKQIGHAHNSYLDLLVTLGWPGLVLGVLAFLIVPVVTSFRALGQPEARAWLGLLILSAITNVTSISYFQPQRAIGLAVVAAYFGLRWARLRSLASRAIPDRGVRAPTRGGRRPRGKRAADPSVRDHPLVSPAGGR